MSTRPPCHDACPLGGDISLSSIRTVTLPRTSRQNKRVCLVLVYFRVRFITLIVHCYSGGAFVPYSTKLCQHESQFVLYFCILVFHYETSSSTVQLTLGTTCPCALWIVSLRGLLIFCVWPCHFDFRSQNCISTRIDKYIWKKKMFSCKYICLLNSL
jgi:hypothetical protein